MAEETRRLATNAQGTRSIRIRHHRRRQAVVVAIVFAPTTSHSMPK